MFVQTYYSTILLKVPFLFLPTPPPTFLFVVDISLQVFIVIVHNVNFRVAILVKCHSSARENVRRAAAVVTALGRASRVAAAYFGLCTV